MPSLRKDLNSNLLPLSLRQFQLFVKWQLRLNNMEWDFIVIRKRTAGNLIPLLISNFTGVDAN